MYSIYYIHIVSAYSILYYLMIQEKVNIIKLDKKNKHQTLYYHSTYYIINTITKLQTYLLRNFKYNIT